MQSTPQYSFHRQAGFSLIEILVGLVIGLLATLVIMQVFSVFEGQKRTTTGAADAQTNGSIAIYSIEQELKMAGYGLLPIAAASPLSCTTTNFGATGLTSIWPAVVTDGGTTPGASDSITVRYATTTSGGVPSTITGVGLTGANDVTLDNNMGCKVGDVAMVVNGTTCSFSKVIAPSAAADNITIGLQDPSIAAVNLNLSCLGSWVTSIFRVNPNYDPSGATGAANSHAYMEKTADPAVAGDPLVSDIVNIQAQYGISAAANSNTVTNWVNATDGQASGNWGASLTIADRNRIKAIHVAVVARSGLYEKAIVTNKCTTTKGTVNNGPCAWDDSSVDAAPEIDLSNDPNWQHYRYRVFETIIPLRNVIWAKSTL